MMNLVAMAQERFGEAAEAYAKCQVQSNDYTLKRLVELLKPQVEWDALDVACGAGHTAVRLAPFVKSIIAVDITEQMLTQTLALARSQGLKNIKTTRAEATSIPIKSGTIDLVSCRLAVHHFSEPGKFWREARRVLKENGSLAIVDSHLPENTALDEINWIQKLHDPSHAKCLTRSQIEENYLASGFKLTAIEEGAIRLGFNSWTKRVSLAENVVKEIRERMTTKASRDTADVLKIEPDVDEGFTFSFQRIIAIGKKI